MRRPHRNRPTFFRSACGAPFVAAAMGLIATDAAAADFRGPMRFSLRQACAEESCRRYVLAEGVIASGTAEVFLAFVAEQKLGRTVVYFDSPGGNLHGGLRLGMLMRELGLHTHVGGPYEAVREAGAVPRVVVAEPKCLSACVYAFAGGVLRSFDLPGKLGVHAPYNRFSDSDRVTPTGTRWALETANALGRYLDEMGVSRLLIDYAAGTPRTAFRELTKEEAIGLNLVNVLPR